MLDFLDCAQWWHAVEGWLVGRLTSPFSTKIHYIANKEI